MYCRGLGVQILARFENHAGFDGVIVGFPGSNYHFEFTRCRTHPIMASPTPEGFVRILRAGSGAVESAVRQYAGRGIQIIVLVQSYWDQRGRTYEDEDGYRMVVQQAAWNPVSS